MLRQLAWTSKYEQMTSMRCLLDVRFNGQNLPAHIGYIYNKTRRFSDTLIL